MRGLASKWETVHQDIEKWKKECREIDDSFKKFNDSLMIKIIEDEKVINRNLYYEIDKIKHAIDLIGENLKDKFDEHKKWEDTANNEKSVLLFFNSAKRIQALACCDSIRVKIGICVNKLMPLFQKLIEYTGGYDCVLKDINDLLHERYYNITYLFRHVLFENEKLSDVLNVSCASSEYRSHLRFCINVRAMRATSPGFRCYRQPTVQYKQSSLRSQLKNEEELAHPMHPSIFVLKKGRLKHSINLLDRNFDINIVRKFIERKEEENAGNESVKALASAHQNKTRSLAGKIKKGLQSQMRILNYCPYCEKPFADVALHADHIYPVSKGGLSTRKNMVYICSICNLIKKNKTLREFIKETNLNRDRIERNLELLKKAF